MSALVLALSAVVLAAPPASANSLSGYKNCVGKGRIVVQVNWWASANLEVAVKQAGPPNSPTWGQSIPGNPFAPDEVFQSAAFVSPYKEGRWSVYSPKTVYVVVYCSSP